MTGSRRQPDGMAGARGALGTIRDTIQGPGRNTARWARMERGEMRTIAKVFRGLSTPSDIGGFLRVGVWSVVIPVLLDLLPVTRALRAITPPIIHGRRRGFSPRDRAVEFGAFWVRVRRRFLGMTCWQRTAILFRCAREKGLPVRIVIGLKKGSPLIGHSWLTLHGRPYLEARRDLGEFRIIYRYP